MQAYVTRAASVRSIMSAPCIVAGKILNHREWLNEGDQNIHMHISREVKSREIISW